jgi:hypothetical protein
MFAPPRVTTPEVCGAAYALLGSWQLAHDIFPEAERVGSKKI